MPEYLLKQLFFKGQSCYPKKDQIELHFDLNAFVMIIVSNFAHFLYGYFPLR